MPVNKGSTFSLTVLVEEANNNQEQESNRQIRRFKQGQTDKTILVIDDIEDNRRLIQKTLEPLGFSVIEANNGLQACNVFEQQCPDLILMDIRMPVMGGEEAIRKIKATEKGKKTPIIAVSASVFKSEQQDILNQGADDFLSKPFKRSQLLKIIGKHLDLVCEYDEDSLPTNTGNAAKNNQKLQTLGKVLIVDDVKVNTLLLRKILTTAGYQCQEASNGADALKIYQTWQPEIVLLDNLMPEMDGKEVLRRINSLPDTEKVPVIIITADSDNEETKRLKSLGAVAVMSKPFKPEEIKTAVSRHIGS